MQNFAFSNGTRTVVAWIKNLPVVNVHKINTVYAHVNGDMQK